MTTEIRNTKFIVSISTIVSLVIATWYWAMVYSWIDKRLTLLEQRQERKAEKEDLKIIEVKLTSIDTTLLELKKELKWEK